MAEKEAAPRINTLAKAVTAFADVNGNLHKNDQEARYASAYSIFCKAVHQQTASGEFMLEEFLEQLRKDSELRNAFYILSITGD